jgi:hypothetical protein
MNVAQTQIANQFLVMKSKKLRVELLGKEGSSLRIG